MSIPKSKYILIILSINLFTLKKNQLYGGRTMKILQILKMINISGVSMFLLILIQMTNILMLKKDIEICLKKQKFLILGFMIYGTPLQQE